MKTFIKSIHSMKVTLLIRTLCACLLVVAFSLATIPTGAGPAQNKAEKAFADWKAAQEAVATAKAKLADAQKALQNAMTAVAKSGAKATAAQEAALAQGREAVARAEAALREAEKQELAARVALEREIAELPDGPLKDRLKRERNFPSLVTANGLHTVKFDTPSGQLTVNLPDDMAAGDTISGTVIPEPKGKTEEERNRNRGVLNGYVVQIQGQNFPVNKGNVGPVVIPPDRRPTGPGIPPHLDSFFDVFVAVDLGNSPLWRARIPLQPTHPSGAIITPDPKITPGFIIPPLGQTGRPMVITGPFDGNSSNTTLRTSVQDFEKNTENVSGGFGLLAESPRKAVFSSPVNVTGPIEVTVKDGGMQATGSYRNVGVDLTAPKTSLLKGESTELRVQVNGLEGIKTPIPLTLECTGVITMEGGNYQPLTIQPSQVGADGRYSTTRSITGVQAGGWGATATVVTRRFNGCLQDDAVPQRRILWNTINGEYVFLNPFAPKPPDQPPPTGSTTPPGLTGTGKMIMKGCIITLQHNAPDRRVFSKLDTCTNTGNASVESGSPKVKFTITDRSTTDNTCAME